MKRLHSINTKYLKPFFAMVFVVIIGVLVIPSHIMASEPPAEPILKIETGMHTAMIRRISVDAENRYLVTASQDKTVRVWDLKSGELIKTLRIPIGDGDEGRVYAVAISPDGRTIACGGWTGVEWDKSFSIYIFDRERGRLTKRITGLPDVTLHLTFSKDGRLLVATLGGGNGIRLYRTSDYNLIGEDSDYGAPSYGADFSYHTEPLLVTTSFDGYIRLYETKGGLKLIRKVKGNSGNMPFSIRFSPLKGGDSRIAVGYYDSTGVNIYSGKNLKYLYSPDTTGVDNGNLINVSWSSDGMSLYGGGRYNKNGKNIIRRWSGEGKGRYKDIIASDNTIMHIVSLKATSEGGYGGIAFGAYDPAFGIITENDKVLYLKKGAIADYRGILDNFRISYDGSTVRFGYEYGGRLPATFSINDRSLSLKDGDLSLNPPITRYPGINITDWEDNYTPKLNGKPLGLEQYEFSRSLAITPDGRGFVLGTEWYIRFYERDGDLKWSVPVPGVAWGVNVSKDGRLVVGALSDGTIRWYKISDGKELLSFFPHADRNKDLTLSFASKDAIDFADVMMKQKGLLYRER